MKIDHDARIGILGTVGEKICAAFLNRKGHVVNLSLDPFDRRKDMMIDNKYTAEVKTEQPYIMKNCLSFRLTQLRKCQEVDVLFFVTIPPKLNENYKHGGKIFMVQPKKFTYFEYETKQRIKMYGIPFEQDAVQQIYTLTADERRELIRYSESAYSESTYFA